VLWKPHVKETEMDLETEKNNRVGRRSLGSRHAAPSLRIGSSPLVLIALAAILCPLIVAPAAAVPSFSPLSPAPIGVQPGLDIRTGISDDGNVVVYGYLLPSSIGYVAKIGEPAIQLQDCPQSGDTSAVRGISGNGLVSVGTGLCASSGGAFEAIHADLTADPEPDETSGTPNPTPPPNGLVSYNTERMGGLLNNSNSQAQAASTDGNVIVGFSEAVGPTTLAFRWVPDNVNDPFATPGVMTSLGTLQGDARSKAEDVSGDGLTVVGESGVLGERVEATVWTIGTEVVMRGLEDLKHILSPLDPSEIISHAFGVSDNGLLVVGASASALTAAPNEQATLWNLSQTNGEAGFAVGLGGLDGSMVSAARAVSFLDGAAVVVGRSANSALGANGQEAFIWTEASGMLSLKDLLVSQGVTGLDSWVLSEASAISIDQGSGLAISGFGVFNGNTQAWVFRGITQVPEPGTGLLSFACLATVAGLRLRRR
jgi:uncharacterized membrane protein